MGVEEKIPAGVMTGKISEVAGYLLKTSMWPATFGLACCAVPMMNANGNTKTLTALAPCWVRSTNI